MMIRSMSCLAALAVLSGCGKQIGSETTVSKRSGRVAVVDIHERRFGGDIAAEALARHRKIVDQSWAPPRMVGVPGAAAAARLPASTLMLVEIAFYPDISCESKAARVVAPNDPERGPPMSPEELARLGKPEMVDRIWMLPASLESEGPFAIGPAWLGNFLREAGPGGTVYFPAYQNCAMPGSTTSANVPRQVFFHGKGLLIRARQPFTARVVAACPADFVVREETLRTHHIPFWRAGFGPEIGTTIERTRRTADVGAHCPGGDARFTLGPFVSDSPYDGFDDPVPKVTATLAPALTRNNP